MLVHTGRNSDGATLRHSNLGKVLEQGTLYKARKSLLLGTTNETHCVTIGDKVFPFWWDYTKENYWIILRKGSITIVFAVQKKLLKIHLVILTHIFRIYNRKFEAKPENADYLILSTLLYIILQKLRKF